MKAIISAVFILHLSLINGQVSITVKNSCPETIYVFSFDGPDTATTMFSGYKLEKLATTTTTAPDKYSGYIYGYRTPTSPVNPDGVTRVQFNVGDPTVYFAMTSVGGGMNYPLKITPSNLFFGCSVTYVNTAKKDGSLKEPCTAYTADGLAVPRPGDGVATQICYKNPTIAFPTGSAAFADTSYTIEFCGAPPSCHQI